MNTRSALMALTFSLWSADALSTERDDLIAEYSTAMGLESTLATSKVATEQMAVAQGEHVVANFRKLGYSEHAISQIRTLFGDVMKQVLGSWTASEASRIYTQAIAESMTDEDLRRAIAFYKSKEGARTLTATNDAAGRLQAYIQDETTKSMQIAMDLFAEKVREIASADVLRRGEAQTTQPSEK